MQNQPHHHGPLRKIVVHTEAMLGAGLLVVLPIGFTVLVLKFFFDLLDPILQPLLQYLPGPHIPGLGIITLALLVYLVGLIAAQVVGRRLINLGHRIMERIPLVKIIYGTTRSGVRILSGTKDQPYRGVVLVEFPRPGMRSIGLVTSTMHLENDEAMVFVFIPTTPVPSSGFLVVVPTKDVTPLDMSVDDAMKVIISGGILARDLFVPPSSLDGGEFAPEPVTVDEAN